MKIRNLCLACAVFTTVPAIADTDPSFILTGTAANFGAYFPSYLSNGYFSTMTSLRGTEPNMTWTAATSSVR